jgi:hypothetical protein
MNISAKFGCRASALLGLSAALAASSLSVVAQTTNHVPMEASLICRQARADETVTARMVSTSMTLVCRPIAVSMRMSDGSMKIIGDVTAKPQSGPDFSKALTPQQMQEACEKWLETVFHIDRNP